jgi:hypothetical protein
LKKQPSRVLSPEEWARVLPVKKIKSSTAITGLLKSMTEAARLNPRRSIVRRAPKRDLLNRDGAG